MVGPVRQRIAFVLSLNTIEGSIPNAHAATEHKYMTGRHSEKISLYLYMLKRLGSFLLIITFRALTAQEEPADMDFEAIPIGGKAQMEQVLQTQLNLPKTLLTTSFHKQVTAYFDLDSAGNAINVHLEDGLNNLMRSEVRRMLHFMKFNHTHKQADVQPYFLVFNLSSEKYRHYFKQKNRHKLKVMNADSSYVVYTRADKAPEYYRNGDEGLSEFILSEIQYPKVAVQRGIEGTVVIEFVVETNGYITDINVKKGLNGGCTEEAISLIKQTRWQPAVFNNKMVRYRMNYPITFNLRSTRNNVSTAQSLD
jgi:protein TonB